MNRERLAKRPGLDLGTRRLGDHGLVGPHALAVKRRQHHLAPRQMLPSLEQEHGARTHHRLQRGAAARRQAVLPARVQGLDRLRIRYDHHRSLKAEEPDAEGIAVAAPAGIQELDRAKEPARGLERGRRGRPRRQGPRLGVFRGRLDTMTLTGPGELARAAAPSSRSGLGVWRRPVR